MYILGDWKEQYSEVSLFKLLRLIRKYKPDIVAVDNIYELVESKGDLINLLKKFPDGTSLVQVTSFQKGESLIKLARRFGLSFDLKNPVDEARVCAILADMGVGYKVSAFSPVSVLTISRARSLGKGGWSQNRYRRKVHHNVQSVVRSVEKILKDRDLRYNIEKKPGYGGLSRGRFKVFAPLSQIPVSNIKTGDVQIKVEALEKDSLEFIPLGKRDRYTIVGVDPGTTTAVAILDLEGNVIKTKSQRNWPLPKVIEYICQFGKPIVIASDVSPPPGAVMRIKKSFDAILYIPKESLSVERKNILTDGYETGNTHEKDALAAALDGFNFHRSKFAQIEKKVPAGMDIDEVKARVLRGETISSAIRENEEEIEERPREKIKGEEIDRLKEELKRKEILIRDLEQTIDIMKKDLKEKEKRIESLERQIYRMKREESYRIRKEREVAEHRKLVDILKEKLSIREREIQELNKRLQSMISMRYMELKGDWKPVKVLAQFTRELIEDMDATMGIREGDVVLLLDPSGGGRSAAEMLCEKKIKALVVVGEMSHIAMEVFIEHDIPIINANTLTLQMFENFAVVNHKEFESVYKKEKDKVVEEMKRRKIKEVEALFEKYKNERTKKIG